MSDLFNGWPEDGEPQGHQEDDHEKRAQDYYDRKVARGEEVAMPAIAIGACILIALIFFRFAWKALT